MKTTRLIILTFVLMAAVLAHEEDSSSLPPTAKQIRAAVERNANVQRSCKRSACVLTQELINGPYYVELYSLLRYNITYFTQRPLLINL